MNRRSRKKRKVTTSRKVSSYLLHRDSQAECTAADNAQKVEFMSHVQGQKRGDDEVQSAIFSGMTFCTCTLRSEHQFELTRPDIPKGTAKHKKADLEALVHRHGGDFSQAQLSDLSAYVIAPDEKSE
jgi:DNA ligase-4